MIRAYENRMTYLITTASPYYRFHVRILSCKSIYKKQQLYFKKPKRISELKNEKKHEMQGLPVVQQYFLHLASW